MSFSHLTFYCLKGENRHFLVFSMLKFFCTKTAGGKSEDLSYDFSRRVAQKGIRKKVARTK